MYLASLDGVIAPAQETKIPITDGGLLRGDGAFEVMRLYNGQPFALADHVKAGVRAAGGTPMEFNTIAISDGITMGTPGMKTSLVSREAIADTIELAGLGYLFDAVVALSGCDKTIPGTVMALARLDVPSVMLYGGSIYPGRYEGHDVTIQDVFEAVGRHAAGDMTDEQLDELVEAASPGSGACGGHTPRRYARTTGRRAFRGSDSQVGGMHRGVCQQFGAATPQ